MNEKIFNLLTEIKIEIAKIRKDINYHIKRTDLLEKKISKHEDNIAIHKRHLGIAAIIKFLTAISLILGILYGVKQVIEWI